METFDSKLADGDSDAEAIADADSFASTHAALSRQHGEYVEYCEQYLSGLKCNLVAVVVVGKYLLKTFHLPNNVYLNS